METRLKHLLGVQLAAKITSSVQWIASYSVYPLAASTVDLNTAQALLAGLFHCLYNEEDTAITLVAMTGQIPHLRSSFIKVWLRDDFNFRKKDIAKILRTLAKLIVDNKMCLESPLLTTIIDLEEKYRIRGYFTRCIIDWSKFSVQPSQGSIPLSDKTWETVPKEIQETKKTYAIPYPKKRKFPSMSEAQDCSDSSTGDSNSIPERNASPGEVVCRENLNDVPKESLKDVPRGDSKDVRKEDSNDVSKKDSSDVSRIDTELSEQNSSLSQLSETEKNKEASTSMKICQLAEGSAKNKALSLLRQYLHTDRVEDLLHTRDWLHVQPIHQATSDMRSDVVEAMLQFGADPNAKHIGNYTPLYIAARKGLTEAVKALLDHGAQVDMTNWRGYTALHMAAAFGHVDSVKLLLAAGANTELLSNEGHKPVDFARNFSRTEIIELLLAPAKG